MILFLCLIVVSGFLLILGNVIIFILDGVVWLKWKVKVFLFFFEWFKDKVVYLFRGVNVFFWVWKGIVYIKVRFGEKRVLLMFNFFGFLLMIIENW